MIEAICEELLLRKNEARNEELQTIYFGGGTPGILTSDELHRILNTVFEHYQVHPHAEITLEANPDDFFKDNRNPEVVLEYLKKLKINRLSIGVQSFFDEDLQLMNRAHNAAQADELLSKATGFFDNITLDLIYGIPGMSLQRWQTNLEKATSLGIPHISAYALTVEPKTALEKHIATGKIPKVDEDEAYGHFRYMVDFLQEKGFVHYELSNFGKKGYFSRNNTAYWTGEKYMGIGPSAHSFDGEKRSWNIAHNIKYMQQIENGILPSETEILSINEQYNELIMTGIRTMEGISLQAVENRFGSAASKELQKQASRHIKSGNLICKDGCLKASPKGKFLTDGIAADLFRVD